MMNARVINRLRMDLLNLALPLSANIPAIHELDCDRSFWPGATWHVKEGQLIRLDWTSQPTDSQIKQVQAVIDAFDSSLTFDEKLLSLDFSRRIMAAWNEATWSMINKKPIATWAENLIVEMHNKIMNI